MSQLNWEFLLVMDGDFSKKFKKLNDDKLIQFKQLGDDKLTQFKQSFSKKAFDKDKYKYYIIKKSPESENYQHIIKELTNIDMIYRKEKSNLNMITHIPDFTKLGRIKKIYTHWNKQHHQYSYYINMPHLKTQYESCNECNKQTQNCINLIEFIINILKHNQDAGSFIEWGMGKEDFVSSEKYNVYDMSPLNEYYIKSKSNLDNLDNLFLSVRAESIILDPKTGNNVHLHHLLPDLICIVKNEIQQKGTYIRSKIITRIPNTYEIDNIIRLITDSEISKKCNSSKIDISNNDYYTILESIFEQFKEKITQNQSYMDLMDNTLPTLCPSPKPIQNISIIDFTILLIYNLNQFIDMPIKNILQKYKKSIIVAGSGHINKLVYPNIYNSAQLNENITPYAEDPTNTCLIDIEKLLIDGKFYPFLDKRVVFGIENLD